MSLWLCSHPSRSHPNVLFMLQFHHLRGNCCVKDLGSANEKCITKSLCGWVGSIVPDIPTVVIHNPGLCSCEEFPAALKVGNFSLVLAPH